ncbi:hypothetical protein HIM_05886 [Hirsutella minnesotensis 3608]|uniref:non-specific serine/threonine protein kinase n=1 Tax=Hirsutella minnesotensis 3608 TaxID=1043627 RepID=A0A0F8A561_9HYPO|nr:hypothetical protein HIM_05886 [Hirsutella minnesotensis 3608]
MASSPHPKTLFHLVPTDSIAHDALLHPDNKRFVSMSSRRLPGLEVGFHVPSKAHGHVITRLGRNADLILRQSTPQNPMSAIHVVFAVNPATYQVMLSVRSKRPSSVELSILEEHGHDRKDVKEVKEVLTGDGVIVYGQNYSIKIASYRFRLFWRAVPSKEATNTCIQGAAYVDFFKALVIQGYQASQELVRDMRSRDRPTEFDVSEAQSWHITRLNTAKLPLFQDIEGLREYKAKGAFGQVFKAVDRSTGHLFAIKVVDLTIYQDGDIEAARALLHKEIKVMERVKHEHIIELLGHQRFDTLSPEIFMPLRDGSLSLLARSPSLRINHDQLSLMVLEQMFQALDYLANENLIHRDIKPDNILYSDLGDGRYLFQLADFGLAHHSSLAVTLCGTGYFQAPELWPQVSKVHAGQSHKLDIWSLFATIVAVHSAFPDFPPKTSDYSDVMGMLRDKA